HQARRVDVIAGSQLRVHPVDSIRGVPKALPIGILADLDEDLAHGLLDPALRGRERPGPDDGPGQLGLGSVALALVAIQCVVLADLALDLGDERANMLRQIRIAHGSVIVPPTAASDAPQPAARPSAPRSQARALSPRAPR